jgi:hypothetical protein
MASRRVLRVRKPDRRKEYLEAVNNLNQRFAKWIEDQVRGRVCAVGGAQG